MERLFNIQCLVSTLTVDIRAASGKNPYDLRRNCSLATQGTACYEELDDISAFLNSTKTKKALGVDAGHNFVLSNDTVSEAFYNSGQALHNSAALLPELVNSGIRLMTYAGDVGMFSP